VKNKTAILSFKVALLLICAGILGFYPCVAFMRGGYTSTLTGFPGQASFPVGSAATPAIAPASFAAANGQTWCGAYPGSLTAWPGGTGAQTISSGAHATSGAGTSGNPYVFCFYDFNAGTSSTTISLSNAIFVGCRFQSNQTTGLATNINPTGANLTFIYDDIVPLVSLHPSPPNAAWPSAGAGQQITNSSASYSSYTIPNADGYQFSFYGRNATGALTVDHSNAWGFANFSNLPDGTTYQFTFSNNWIHDARNDGGAGGDHTDGPGYLNGPTGANPSNITISGNTIASIGNTNAIAMQGGTGTVSNLIVTGNYLSGFGDNVFLGGVASGSNSQFENNVFGTDLPWEFNPLHGDYSSIYTVANTNLWRNNKLNVLSGTSPVSGSSFNWTAGQNGFYIWPSAGASTPVLPQSTDWSN
jgi:hypothetical protein